MGKVNKVLFAFFASVLLILFSLWRGIQTESFAHFVSKNINRAVLSKLGGNASFSRIEVKLFPPSTIVKDFKFNKSFKNSSKIKIQSNELGIYFSLFDFFSKKLSVSEISIVNGTISIDGTFSESKKIDSPKRSSYLEEYNLIRRKLPIKLRSIRLEGVLINSDFGSLISRDSSLDFYETEVGGNINVEQVNILKPKSLSVDSFVLDFNLYERHFEVWSFEVKDKFDVIKGRGQVAEKKGEKTTKGSLSFSGGLERVAKYLPEKSRWNGFVEGEIDFAGKLLNPKVEAELKVTALETPWVKLDEAIIGVRKDADKLIITKFQGKRGNGLATLTREAPLWDLKKNNLINSNSTVIVNDFYTNDAFYFIEDIFKGVKGWGTGEIALNWNSRALKFKMRPGLKLRGFQFLINENRERPLLTNELIKFQQGDVTLLFKDKGVLDKIDIDTEINFQGSFLKAKGEITENGLNIITRESLIDLNELGPIAGVDLKGRGPLNIKVQGPFDNILFYFDGALDQFSVLGLHFGQIQSSTSFDLQKGDFNIRTLQGTFDETSYTGNGVINFRDQGAINAQFNFPQTSYSTALKMYDGLIRDSNFPDDINFNFSTSYQVSGDLSLDGLKVLGQLQGGRLSYRGEDAQNININYQYEKQRFLINELSFDKGSGRFLGKGLFDLKTSYLEYDGELFGVKLTEVNWYELFKLGLEGSLQAEFYGSGTRQDFSSRSLIKINKSEIDGVSVEDSEFVIYNNGSDLLGNGQILGDLLTFETLLDFNEKTKDKKSFVKASAKTSQIRKVLGVLASENIFKNELQGKLSASLESRFNLSDFESMDLSIALKDFELESDVFSLVKNDESQNRLIVKDGKIITWDLALVGENENFVMSKGGGSFSKNYKIDYKFQLPFNLLTLYSKKIEEPQGTVRGSGSFLGGNKKHSNYFESKSENLSFKVDGIPGFFSKLAYRLVLLDKNLTLQYLNTEYGKGRIEAKGTIDFYSIFPEVNIDLSVDKSQIDKYSKSQFVISGKGVLSGRKLPYDFSGNFSILHGEILNELEDFSEDGGISSNEKYEKFIPKTSLVDDIRYLNLNIGADIFKPIIIKNKLADLLISGNVNVKGGIDTALYDGQLSIVPGQSKFTFKGHEFRLSEGDIIFTDTVRQNAPEIKFAGNTRIGDYDIRLNVSGRSDKVNLELSSEPPLSQEDILSLITIGITTDISKDLDEGERQSITTVGIGSLLVDQLKINQGLNSFLGLKLSVAPEFLRNETDLIQGRSGVSDGGANRIRSATKVKIEKKISEKVDLSLSSTVGGTLEQTQEMNINYNINKRWALEGIYEKRSSEEELEESPESIGADFKFKWSF